MIKINYKPLLILFNCLIINIASEGQVNNDTTAADTIITINTPFVKKNNNIVSSSVSSINGSKITVFPAQVIEQTLSGLIPGLTVINPGVEPGRESSILRIRGQHSFQNNDPLIFVDGFETTMSQLSAYEIETISVLKDAAALVPFGLRGANGVIWVTTKRSSENDKLKIEFNTRTGISKPFGLPQFLNSYDYARLYNEALSNDMGTWAPRYTEEQLNYYKTGSDPLFYPDVNWQKEVLKNTAINHETSLIFKGSVSNMKYFIMLGYLSTPKLYKSSNEDGNLSDKSSTRRYNFRSNVDVTINKIFDASITIGASLVNNARPNIGSIWGAIAATPPNAYLPQNPDNSWSGNSVYNNNPAAAVMALGRLSNNDRRIQTIFTLRENLDQFAKGLSLKQSIGFDNMNSVTYNVTQNYARFSPRKDPATGEITYVQLGNSVPYAVAQGSPSQFWRVAYQAAINYDRQWGGHGLKTSVNYRFGQQYFAVENPPYNDIVLSGNLNYNFQNKYFSEISMAYSGSENFAPGKRFGFFPAIAAGWNISEEGFLKDVKWLDHLKLKGSFGIVGNSDIGAWRFLYKALYPSGTSYILANSGTRSVATIIEGTGANPNVTWESSNILNLGIDFSLFDNKIGVIAEVFSEKRNDILTRRDATVPAIIGIGSPYENIGKVNNKGFEITVDWKETTGQLKYGASAVISMARNKIIYQDEIVRREDYLYRTGKRIGQVFALEAIGFFQSYDEINNPNTPVHTFAPVKPGDLRYKDNNNDGIINEEDQIAVGYTNNIPEITGSFSGWMQYKNFDLNFIFSGMANRTLYISGANVWAFRDNGQAPDMALNRWVYYPDQGLDTRNTATYPRLSASGTLNNERISTFWLKNGNFIRLRNVELGYTFLFNGKADTGISKIRVYCSGINLLTLSKMGNWDPEALPGTYPLTRSGYLGLNVTF